MRRGTKKLTLISLIIFALLGLQACKNKKLLDKNEKNPTVQTFQAQSNGPQTLGKSPYDYTLWYQGGVKHTLSWYGASQRGGAAFKATWSDSDDFLARVGYSWTNAGEDIKNIGNISCQFSYKKSGEGTAGNYNYI
ncbi:MAG: glycoside hydrolase family 11 protein, partial [Lactococcus cremoris]